MQSSVNGIARYTNVAPAAGPATSRQLDEAAFLELLMAQLRYQDPLKPLEDKEFLAQTAQFNSLQQMREMNQSFQSLLSLQSLAGGAEFVGKTVEVSPPESEAPVRGRVTRVLLRDGALIVVVDQSDGQPPAEYPAGAITAIHEA